MPRLPNANCYGYALGLNCTAEPGTRHFSGKLRPENNVVSEWSRMGGVKRVTAKHRRDLLAACEHDGLTQKSTKFKDGVKIAVFIHLYDDCIDYHFYREEPDGGWSHKLGASGLEQDVREPKTADSALVDLGVASDGSTIRWEAFVGYMWAPKSISVDGKSWNDDDDDDAV